MTESNEANIEFQNTEIAFSYKSDKELRKTYRLFQLMNNPGLVKIGSFFGSILAKLPLHVGDPIIKETIFNQFCGGVSLLECQSVIDKLHSKKTLTILDYGAEAKETDEDFQATLDENLKAIEFAYSTSNVPVVSTKLTGFVPLSVLEKMQSKEPLDNFEKLAKERLEERFLELCEKAYELGVSIFVDAEESWIQEPIDELTRQAMVRFNKERPIIYNTYQMYRKHRLDGLKQDFEFCKSNSVILGAKIVRGAYMEKERKRAEEKNYEDPIQPNKEQTDLQYNDAIRFCLEDPDRISLCNASHNQESNALQVKLMKEKNLANDHPHLNFCQLYGMSDHLTFNLAAHHYNVAKYVPYGPIKDVIPYLIRRAQENSSVTGDMGRELSLLNIEMKRRGLLKNT
ncbi:MAG TPA: proline dehydrogenase family protein [Saprospiraceae bacterium]|nr:proline dehydrogenase family protein [Saprospiraceae bacterium]